MGRLTTLNESFFREPTHDMFYVLGLVYADGNVYFASETYTWSARLTLVSTDRELVESVARALNFNGKVSRVWQDGWAKEQWRIQVYSDTLARDLMAWGVVPRKSWEDLPFPDIPQEYLPSFVRGHFDGDGCVSPNRRGTGARVRIAGTKKFITGLREALGLGNIGPHSLSSHTFMLNVDARSEVREFRDFIYSTPGIRLERKYQRFQELN